MLNLNMEILMRYANKKVRAEKIRAIPKNFLILIAPEGIGRSVCAIASISASVISFHIRVAKNPEYNVKITRIIITTISML